MASLKETIDKKLKEAMKAREEITVSTLRLLRAGIKNAEIETGKALADADILPVIKKMVKQGKESIEQFSKGNRADLVAKVQKELAVLKPFMPAQMNTADLKKIIQAAIQDAGATSLKQMGAVMKAASEKIAGRADMKEVSRIVRELLSGS